MSESNKTETMTNSISSSNTQKDSILDKNKVKNNTESNLTKSKEHQFQEIVSWLRKWGYETKDSTKDNKIEGIEYQAQITPQLPYSSGSSTPLFLEYQKDLDDGFIIRTTFELDNQTESKIKEENFDIEYSELESIIYPMNISMIKSYPSINVYKVMFHEDLTKRLFLEGLTGIIHSMSLIISKMNRRSRELVQQV
ncbi:hypothetical protein [Candidatus Nitrosocosmicus sp. SS]|jgi:hypothetical protein|uniref:hypothetical protein n=1 Tax=Candidatus Nitrosocosmicus agrestis TaxID=2563600 RepID=UPI00122DF154|nr:hypothetical protein [Candidatus Nitrosocosmicus sp. SS]KAA2281213.1 hypothetical protein F1Z66_08820 [Candidatus Nitrosocosmicus sp. SS]KAF0868371.1 hypothetical protein E5N71_10480 [Candidatus Nitrosocosmicus sp. SS]MDR4490473.1 hypothetical protein [Candidatus Nitrosocosmicus sp.]